MKMFNWRNDLTASFDTAGDWPGAGPSTDPEAIPFNAGGGLGSTGSATSVATKAPKLTTLVSFTGADGEAPYGSLITDAGGDLFGTTDAGGSDGDGTVFEIAKTKKGYASEPTTLVSFTGSNGEEPVGSLLADAAGNLLGTTEFGGANGFGTVFEIAKTKQGYASAPTILFSCTISDGTHPQGSLIADAAGDLLGTAYSSGANSDGTVFEIAKTKQGYASAPTVLFNFTGADGAGPQGSLLADAAGDLFGTTYGGGAHGDGTVFEIAKTKGGYAAATTLVSFTGSNGDQPLASLIFDAAGDLFGTTSIGGGDNVGTVFEIAKTKSGYASAPTILYSFTGAADGEAPYGSLIADTAGDLFGTAAEGGSNGDGTVFEISKTNSGYASKPTTLVSFTGSNGAYPLGGLIADAEGDLFSTTVGYGSGPDGDGTVFEITNSGYVTPATTAAHGAHASPTGAAFVQAMASFGASRSGETSPTFLASRHETSMHLSPPHQVA